MAERATSTGANKPSLATRRRAEPFCQGAAVLGAASVRGTRAVTAGSWRRHRREYGSVFESVEDEVESEFELVAVVIARLENVFGGQLG